VKRSVAASRRSSTWIRASDVSSQSISGRRGRSYGDDLLGRQLASVTSFPTERDPKRFVAGLAKRVNAILAGHHDLGRCEGVGVVVPGMVDTDGRCCQRPIWVGAISC